MLEAIVAYEQAGPLLQALLLVPAGLVMGSFTSVVVHRLPSGGSLLTPRSRCPMCYHLLGVRDLIPVVSFLWQRGRCRYCRQPIPWRYPALEIGAAVALALSVMAGGLGAVTGVAILWIGGALVWAWRRRTTRTSSQSGVSLVEVLVAVGIVALAAVPTLDAVAVARQAGLAAQRRSLVVGLARARINQLASIAEQSIDAVDGEAGTTDGYALTGESSLQPYVIQTQVTNPYPTPGVGDQLRQVTVTVSCPSCKGRFGNPVPPTTLTSVVQGS